MLVFFGRNGYTPFHSFCFTRFEIVNYKSLSFLSYHVGTVSLISLLFILENLLVFVPSFLPFGFSSQLYIWFPFKDPTFRFVISLPFILSFLLFKSPGQVIQVLGSLSFWPPFFYLLCYVLSKDLNFVCSKVQLTQMVLGWYCLIVLKVEFNVVLLANLISLVSFLRRSKVSFFVKCMFRSP